ncbi:MAG: hypothetical protein HY360_20630 [Verrucomicrobia bacterium]|nr:hypothetical protein [Verrucomicrobiota bacterium]
MSVLHWNPVMDPLVFGGLALGAAGFVYWTGRSLLGHQPRRKVFLLLAPKAILFLLLFFALLDPSWNVGSSESRSGRILALLDVSASMDTADDGHQTRIARARRLLDELKQRLPPGFRMDVLEFDTELHKAGGRSPLRGTDLAGCLTSLAEQSGTGAYAGIVAVTDGGDEPVEPARLPSIPLDIVAVGTPSSSWNDVSVSAVDCPATVEQGIDFEIRVELQAYAGGAPGFARNLEQIKTQLERAQDGAWIKVAEKQVNLSNLRAQFHFRTSTPVAGRNQYRVRMEDVPGELSTANNARVLNVDAQMKSLRVLYFTKELGVDYKVLRSELASDPGISFTGFFKTTNDQFTIQGDRPAGDPDLETGFLKEANALKRCDCLIVGSFSASDWDEDQMQFLVKYVEEGGAAIFLGGERSFGLGGYAATKFQNLFPWAIAATEPPLQRGGFRVNVPPAAAQLPVMSGLKELLFQAEKPQLESVNLPGALRASAVCLLSASVGEKTAPVIAMSPFGKGKVMGIASNTLWKWASGGEPLRNAYGRFWRQAIRHLANKTEGNQVLSVQWNQAAYRPGETAQIQVSTPASISSIRLTASLTGDGRVKQLPVQALTGLRDVFAVKTPALRRGVHQFRLVAYQADSVLESYEKTLSVAPLLEEGSRPEVNELFLGELARKGAGILVREKELDRLIENLSRTVQKESGSEIPITQAGGIFLSLVLAVMILEWFVRRRMNLI